MHITARCFAALKRVGTVAQHRAEPKGREHFDQSHIHPMCLRPDCIWLNFVCKNQSLDSLVAQSWALEGFSSLHGRCLQDLDVYRPDQALLTHRSDASVAEPC